MWVYFTVYPLKSGTCFVTTFGTYFRSHQGNSSRGQINLCQLVIFFIAEAEEIESDRDMSIFADAEQIIPPSSGLPISLWFYSNRSVLRLCSHSSFEN